MKRLVRAFINRLGRAIIAKHKPVVVAVTGSVGKTTTKDAIYEALQGQRRTIRALGSQNAEWGVFLSIVSFEKKSGAYARLTVGELLRAITRGLRIWAGESYAEILVLEVGADRPGDISYLTRYYPPDVAVITNVGPSHLVNYPDVGSIAAEKWQLVRGLKPGGVAVLNADDPWLERLGADHEGPIIWYGTERGEVMGDRIKSRPDGVSYRLRVGKYERTVSLQARGGAGVFASLAALGVVVALELDLERAIVALEEFEPPPGRLAVEQINSFTLIDDTYNASPASMRVALDYLQTFKGRKVAVLGEMRELGAEAKRAHLEVGEWAAEAADRVIVVGEAAQGIAEGAGKKGRYFETVEELLAGLSDELQAGDTVLVKASRGVYLERVAEAIKDKHLHERIGAHHD